MYGWFTLARCIGTAVAASLTRQLVGLLRHRSSLASMAECLAVVYPSLQICHETAALNPTRRGRSWWRSCQAGWDSEVRICVVGLSTSRGSLGGSGPERSQYVRSPCVHYVSLGRPRVAELSSSGEDDTAGLRETENGPARAEYKCSCRVFRNVCEPDGHTLAFSASRSRTPLVQHDHYGQLTSHATTFGLA